MEASRSKGADVSEEKAQVNEVEADDGKLKTMMVVLSVGPAGEETEAICYPKKSRLRLGHREVYAIYCS